jgi:hypothetical protein
LGQLHGTARSGQQRLPDLPFEALNLRTDRGLRHPFALRRLGETALFDHCDEILELT